MDISEFVNGITFKLVQPMDMGVVLAIDNPVIVAQCTFDTDITVLPEMDAEYKALLRDVMKMPRMSTFAIGAIIHRCVAEMDPSTSFVNVGVWNGFSFLCGLSKNLDKTCVGIDNFSEFGGPRDAFLERFNKARSEQHSFHEMDYQDYFANVHEGEIGFYIYDGEHSRENQRKGLEVAEPFFSENCMILVDDINVEGAIEGTRDFIAGAKHRYEKIFMARTGHNMHPTFWNGILMLRRVR